MPTLEVLLEGERRGLLNPQQTSVLGEARRRGMAPRKEIKEFVKPTLADNVVNRLSSIGSSIADTVSKTIPESAMFPLTDFPLGKAVRGKVDYSVRRKTPDQLESGTEYNLGILPAREDVPGLMKGVERAFLPLTAPFNVAANLMIAAINRDPSRLDAIANIIKLSPQEGDQPFTSGTLKALGFTDKSFGLPDGTIDNIGLVGDVMGMGRLDKLIQRAQKGKDVAKVFEKGLKESTVDLMFKGKLRDTQKLKPHDPRLARLAETVEANAEKIRVQQVGDDLATELFKDARVLPTKPPKQNFRVEIDPMTGRSVVLGKGEKLPKISKEIDPSVMPNKDLAATDSFAKPINKSLIAVKDINSNKTTILPRNLLNKIDEKSVASSGSGNVYRSVEDGSLYRIKKLEVGKIDQLTPKSGGSLLGQVKPAQLAVDSISKPIDKTFISVKDINSGKSSILPRNILKKVDEKNIAKHGSHNVFMSTEDGSFYRAGKASGASSGVLAAKSGTPALPTLKAVTISKQVEEIRKTISKIQTKAKPVDKDIAFEKLSQEFSKPSKAEVIIPKVRTPKAEPKITVAPSVDDVKITKPIKPSGIKVKAPAIQDDIAKTLKQTKEVPFEKNIHPYPHHHTVFPELKGARNTNIHGEVVRGAEEFQGYIRNLKNDIANINSTNPAHLTDDMIKTRSAIQNDLAVAEKKFAKWASENKKQFKDYIESQAVVRQLKTGDNALYGEHIIEIGKVKDDLVEILNPGKGTPFSSGLVPRSMLRDVAKGALKPEKGLKDSLRSGSLSEGISSESGFLSLGRDKSVEFTGEAKKIMDFMDESSKVAAKMEKTTVKQVLKTLETATVDTSAGVKRGLLKRAGVEGRNAVMDHDFVAGAHAKAIEIARGWEEKVYGSWWARLTGKPGAVSTRVKKRYLDAVIMSKSDLSILEKLPNRIMPGGGTAAGYKEVLKQIPDHLKRELDEAAEIYFDAMRSQLDDLLKAGLISNSEHSLMAARRYYQPHEILEYVDPGSISGSIGGKVISVPSSGLKLLSKEGSLKRIRTDSEYLLRQVINRTQARIARNKANQSAWAVAEKFPDNGIFIKAEVVGGKFAKAPAGHEAISVMIGGKQHVMHMPKEFAKEWVTSDPMLSPVLANIVGNVTGTKLLKFFATTVNPEFAVSNFFRDVAHIWLTTQQYSSTLPVAGLQMADDIAHVIKDAVLRKGLYKDYVMGGGGTEFLTHQGRLFSQSKRAAVKNTLGSLEKFFGYAGETSEITTRLALMRRTMRNLIKQGVHPDQAKKEAIWQARNYLDFSQGGSFAKAVNNAIPYLNASIQGTRGIFRAAFTSKKGFLTFGWKFSQIGTLASGLYLANNYMNPEGWDQVSDREKTNNWIVMMPKSMSYVNKNGDRKYLYFKIAKDQGQRLFATLFENASAKSIGKKVSGDQVVQALTDFSPITPTSFMPPTVEAIMGYTQNRDFWMNEDIWKKTDPLPFPHSGVESHLYTHPAFTKVGEATGLSPERLNFALSQVFTRGNIYTSALGYTWNHLTKDLPKGVSDQVAMEAFIKKPFVRRVMRVTDPYFAEERNIEKAKEEQRIKFIKQTNELDKLSSSVYAGTATNKELRDFIRSQPREDRKKLSDRHNRWGKLEGVPEKRWWMDLARFTPELRANVYHNRLMRANEDERRMLETYVRKVPGVGSTRFYRKLNELKKKSK